MSDRANLVRVLTSATGTGTMTLGAAYSQLFMTSAEANMVDGRTYTYLIVDGNNWELGKGVYTASGTTLSRVTVLASRISSTLGTTKVTLSGTAQVRIIESADDMGALRGTRAVTGTSDALAQTDLGRAVTYSNAAAIAVSLAQAGASSSFLDGWCAWVQNLGAGAVTITPATSTINGAATLVLAQNLGAFIWSDGTNYHAYYVPITKPLLAANNLSELASAATARTNLGVLGASNNLSDLASAATARANLAVVNSVNITKFTADDTYTVPANLLYAIVECVGGGGGGGGVAGVAAVFLASGGGAAGGYSRVKLTKAQLGSSVTVDVGAGGAGGTAGNNAGTAGSATTFVASGPTTLCAASGGGGGNPTSSTSTVGGASVPGSGTTGDLLIDGSAGGGGFSSINAEIQAFYTGFGGASHLSGNSMVATGASAGTAGRNFGGGGSGATSVNATSRAGGGGAPGIVIITEYLS